MLFYCHCLGLNFKFHFGVLCFCSLHMYGMQITMILVGVCGANGPHYES